MNFGSASCGFVFVVEVWYAINVAAVWFAPACAAVSGKMMD